MLLSIQKVFIYNNSQSTPRVTKTIRGTKQFETLFEIDKDISTKSKFFILKTIQKSLDERVNVEGEEIQKATWFKETIAKIKSSAGVKRNL